MPLTDYVALVSLTRDISTSNLLQVAAAVQKQVTRDFAPLWGIRANVNAFDNLADVPNDYHPVVLFGQPEELLGQLELEIGKANATRMAEQFQSGRLAGIHANAFTRQPFALIQAGDDWSVVVSHEVLEMLADPYGNRLIAARHPIDPDERAKYLLEICDPCQTVGYTVNGWKMSDFYTPRYFDPVQNPAAFYSFTGSIEYPLHILDGGYVSWIDPRDSGLYQLEGGSDEPVRLADITTLARTSAPLRTVVDTNAATPRVTGANFSVVGLPGTDPARSHRAVQAASQASALRNAEAFLSLAAEAEAWE
jgi:hypothetical protein